MSGIYGIVSFFSKRCEIDITHMEKWNLAYGRDSKGCLEHNGIKIGCCMEKLSDGAMKSVPVLHRNGKTAVIDALLYNREELIEKCNINELCSDEELLLLYVEAFGYEALKDVNGDFAGVIYEEKSGRVTLFRDHMGVRPLFYFRNEEFLAFSSDLRGLISLQEVDATISEDWIFKSIAGYSTISTEKTEFEHIYTVAPAQYIHFSYVSGKVKQDKNIYWKPGTKKIRYSSDEAYQARLRELVTDAVERRLAVVSGPVGGELSGGMDSGVIDILINRAGRKGVYFSWSASPESLPYAENDERLVIKDICEQEKITCNFSGGESYFDKFSNMAESMREMGLEVSQEELPALRYAIPPYVNALAICETSQFINRRGAKVVFTGHGGDEGISHRCNPYELYYHREYIAFLKHFWEVTKGQPRRFIRTLKHCRINIRESKARFGKAFCEMDGTLELLKKDFVSKFNEANMSKVSFAYDPKSHVIAGATCNRLNNVSLLGAYCGVRYMAPFMDYRVMDFALSIPRSQYLKHRVKRYIYREAFKDIMPQSLYELTIKENNSKKNLKPNPNWFEEFAKKKRETVEHLDRGFWEKYLDFEKVDAWLQRGEPSAEERFRETSILTNLFYCALAENLVKKSREV